MNEFFTENDFEKQFPELVQLPIDALPLPEIGVSGTFFRSFVIPTNEDRSFDLTKINDDDHIFICEETAPKQYRYVIGHNVHWASNRVIDCIPAYTKPTFAHRHHFGNPHYEWQSPDHIKRAKFDFHFIRFATLLRQIDVAMILRFFPYNKTTIAKHTILFHGSNHKWDELKEKPIFLSFRRRDAWLKHYIYRFELLEDISALDLTLSKNGKRTLVSFLLNNSNQTGAKIKEAILRLFEKKTMANDFESYIFFMLNDETLVQGIKEYDRHFTVGQFEDDSDDTGEDNPQTDELQIFRPVQKLKFISREKLEITKEQERRYQDELIDSKIRLGTSISKNTTMFIERKPAVPKFFNQYIITENGMPICRHTFLNLKQLKFVLQNPKHKSELICPHCIQLAQK